MGYYQEAYDAECAAIARALAVAAGRAKRHKLGRVRIFTDAQAAITRMTHRTRSDLHHPGEASDSDPAQTGTRHRDRDSLVPGPQGDPRRGQVGQVGR